MEKKSGAVPKVKLILDTNCYISYLNQRNREQHRLVSGILESVSRAEHDVLLTGHNMTEIAFVLKSIYEMEAKRIHQILSALLNNPGIEFSPGHYPLQLLELWPTKVKDYGHAVLASAAKTLGAEVFTFDQPFARSLKRLQLLADLR